MQPEVTETVFSSEVHSVRRNPNKSLPDYDSNGPLINYNSTSNNVAQVNMPKSNFRSSNHTPTHNMAVINDGEVVVFDDIDDNWQNLRLDLHNNTHHVPSNAVQNEQEGSHRGRTPSEPLSSSICSSPSPTTTYHRNHTTEFFNTSDRERDYPSPESLNNHKVPRVIGELPIAQYTESPRRYGIRDSSKLPSILSSPSAVYVPPRPGFPQRILPTTPSQKEVS